MAEAKMKVNIEVSINEIKDVRVPSSGFTGHFFLTGPNVTSRQIAEQINEYVYDGVKRFGCDCNSFSQLEINQCYDYLKHNGYEPYFKDGILSAKK